MMGIGLGRRDITAAKEFLNLVKRLLEWNQPGGKCVRGEWECSLGFRPAVRTSLLVYCFDTDVGWLNEGKS